MVESVIDEVFWSALFPKSPSDEAIRRLRILIERIQGTDDFFQALSELLITEQSRLGVRLHNGLPLYWMAASVANSGDKRKATELMMEAFAEDVLTTGHDASLGFAASSLRRDFGLSSETLISLKDHVMEKARSILYPSALVRSYLNESSQEVVPKEGFGGVSEESRLDSRLAQLREKLNRDLRPSIGASPSNEADVQDVVFTILRQTDPKVEREYFGGRVAGKDSKIDFPLFQNKIGVEVKLVKEKGRERAVIDEIAADIPFYLKSLKRLLFIVYDACGAINDPT